MISAAGTLLGELLPDEVSLPFSLPPQAAAVRRVASAIDTHRYLVMHICSVLESWLRGPAVPSQYLPLRINKIELSPVNRRNGGQRRGVRGTTRIFGHNGLRIEDIVLKPERVTDLVHRDLLEVRREVGKSEPERIHFD